MKYEAERIAELLDAAVNLIATAHGIELAPLEAKGDYYYDEREVKRWITDGDPCEFCQEMEDMGWIDMDDVFPTDSQYGDVDEPPAHLNCECEVEYKTQRYRVYDSARPPIDGIRMEEALSLAREALVLAGLAIEDLGSTESAGASPAPLLRSPGPRRQSVALPESR